MVKIKEKKELMTTYKERQLLSGLNGPYNRIANLVEKREEGIPIYSVTNQDHENLRDFISLSKSKKMDRVRHCNSKHLSKNVLKIVEQLLKTPIIG